MKKATNEMRSEKRSEKNSARRKLIPAIGMLTVSAMMLSSSTYAWFTMNKEVEVYGMELKTKVGANLLICSDNVEANYSAATLHEGRMGLLEPVSSINGTTGSFFYTTNATARGNKDAGATVTAYNENIGVANAVAGKNKYDKAFNGAYAIHTTESDFTTDEIKMVKQTGTSGEAGYVAGQDGAAYGYIDYVFYVKATSDAANQKLMMTECNMLYNGAAITSPAIGDGDAVAGVNIDRAWRVGVFAEPLDASTEGGKGNSGANAAIAQKDPASAATKQKGILGLADSTYFTPKNAQNSTTANDVQPVVNFMNGNGTADAEGYAATGVVLDTIANSGTTAYYKVLVRVWLEGEDNTCNSETYAKLTNNWSINCKFELDTDDTKAVKQIGTSTETEHMPATSNTQEAVTDPIDVAAP
ncbi:MAG: hypothetical protein IJ825_01080 [Oscillospiraceae bacterium]|nr:hypothetical protein [Oscillospiraceae bacterium]